MGFSGSFGSLALLKSQIDEKVKILKQGDLLGSSMQTLVNTVNCVGVMGKGVALLFKEAYPAMFDDYHRRCVVKTLEIGKPYLFKVSDTRWILNFPTKDHWRQNSKVSYIEDGLKYLTAHYHEWGITSLAVPPLGCGNGGLSWEREVYPLVEKHLLPLSIPIEIYTPFEKHAKTKTRIMSKHDSSDKEKPPFKKNRSYV